MGLGRGRAGGTLYLSDLRSCSRSCRTPGHDNNYAWVLEGTRDAESRDEKPAHPLVSFFMISDGTRSERSRLLGAGETPVIAKIRGCHDRNWRN